MAAFFELANGRYAGTSVVLERGDLCHVGSRATAHLCPADDEAVELTHCVISFGKTGAQVVDMSQSGTFVNGERTRRRVLRHGDWIVCGTTLLIFRDESRLESESATQALKSPIASLIQFIRESGDGTYFLGDVEQSNPLRSFVARLASTEVAWVKRDSIVLVRVPQRVDLLEALLRRTWSTNCGIYLRSSEQRDWIAGYYTEMVELTPKHRFFDPRVMRSLLPVCTESERQCAFGPAHVYLMESQLPQQAVVFGQAEGKLKAELIPLVEVRPKLPSQSEIRDRVRGAESHTAALASFARQLRVESPPLAAHAGFRSESARIQSSLISVLYPDADLAAIGVMANPDEELQQFVDRLNRRRG